MEEAVAISVVRFVNPVTLSFEDFQRRTLNCARISARKLITCKFFGLRRLRRLRILDEIMPQMKYSCCIFVVMMLDLLCIQ